MGKYEKYHKYHKTIPGMSDKIESVIKDKETGQRGSAEDYEGGNQSFDDLDKKAFERMKQEKKNEQS